MAWTFSASKLSPLVASVALGVLATGCAASASSDVAEGGEADALVAPSVVVADTKATQSAEVLADSVRIPAAAAAKYRTLAAGAIFASARGAATGKNPDGFLRRVVSVSDEGGTLVIATTRAALTDAIVDGSVRTSSNGSPIDDYGAGTQSITPLTRKELSDIAIDFSDKPLYDGVDDIEIGGKKAHFVESIRLEHAAFSSKPAASIDLRIKDGRVSRFIGKVEGNLDTSVSATATVTAEGDVTSPAILAELRTRKHEVKRVLYQSPRVALPNFAVGGVPVSPSVQFTVTLRCQIAFGGALVAHAGVEATSNVRLGGVYDGATWGEPITSDFTIKPTFTMDQGGEIDARCAIEASSELSLYGDSGITMTVAPYVDFGVKSAGPGYHFKVDAGADGEMHGRADVFGVRQEDLDRTLVQWKAGSLLEGDAP